MSEEKDNFEMSGVLLGTEEISYEITKDIDGDPQIRLSQYGDGTTMTIGEFEHLCSRVAKFQQIINLIKEHHQ